MATIAAINPGHFEQAPAAPQQPQARVAGSLPNQPLAVLPVEGDGRRFYVLSRREEIGWLAVFIGDEKRLPSCECEHHRFRLAGTNKRCRHLEAAHGYRKEHSMTCSYCDGVMETRLERREAGLLVVAQCEDCGVRRVL